MTDRSGSCGSRLRLVGMLLACAASAQLAQAQDAGATDPSVQQVQELLSDADANDDGSLTLAELESTLKERFSRMDRNGDGVANPSDAPAMFRRQYMSRVGPVIEQRDANKDGDLSYAEFSGRMLENFAAADEDKDGAVEIATLIDAMRSRSASTP